MIEIPPFYGAACAEADPEDFHPDGTWLEVRTAEARAKMVCAECPVRLACLTWQMDFEDGKGASSRWGVYGGLSAGERARLAKQDAA